MKKTTPFPLGTKKDYLTITEVIGWSKSNRWRYKCQCECGKTCERSHNSLLSSETISSCGCMHPSHRAVKIGEKYGKLTVIEEVEPRISPTGRINRQFKCKCDCGVVDVFLMSRLSQMPHCYNCSQKDPIRHEDIDGEEWKSVVGWEDKYEVSNKGRIRSLDRIVNDRLGRTRTVKGQAMRLQKDKNGYATFGIKNHGKAFIVKVHRAVAEAFIPNPDGKGSVDHINGIKDDNRVENLRWCTTKENVNFPLAKKNRSEAIRKSYIINPQLREIRANQFRKVSSKPCIVFLNDVKIGEFSSTIAASKAIGISQPKANEIALSGNSFKGYRIVRI